jgi:hypothetical protein
MGIRERDERSDIAFLGSIIAKHFCYKAAGPLLGIWKIQLVRDVSEWLLVNFLGLWSSIKSLVVHG